MSESLDEIAVNFVRRIEYFESFIDLGMLDTLVLLTRKIRTISSSSRPVLQLTWDSCIPKGLVGISTYTNRE